MNSVTLQLKESKITEGNRTRMGAKQQGADQTENRWLTIPRTLCFVMNEDDVLLMKRASTRRVFPNSYNGLGGHIERDETPIEGAIREIKEESGIDVDDIFLCGTHMIDTGQTTGILLFTYKAFTQQRNFVEDKREGTLHWVHQADALRLDLVEDLPLILPRVFEAEADNNPYNVHVSYDENDQILMKFTDDRK
jgi:8-oxo-dGTP diphosphatase